MGLYRLYSRIVAPLRNSRMIHRYLFGYYPPVPIWGQYWDWTTIKLRGCLKRLLKPEMELLDMGCGPYAVLAMYANSVLSCRSVTAVDHCGELIDFAKTLDANKSITFLCCDLFSNATKRYDLIVFNAPYLETENGVKKDLFYDELAYKRFCGGANGADTIQRFLCELPSFLKVNGRALLGVNHFHIRAEVVEEEIHKSHLKIAKLHMNHLTKACVYELMESDYAKM